MADNTAEIGGLLDMKRAANYLGLSKNYLYQLVSDRAITFYKPNNGRKTFFKRQDLEAWATARCFKSNSELEEEAARYALNSKRRR